MDKERCDEILRKYLRFIKRTIKNKIGRYEPLDFKTAYKAFLQWIHKEGCKVIREFPGGDSIFENYLDDLIRRFLVEKTFFCLLFEDRDLVENYVKKILKSYDMPPELQSEITFFVKVKLENEKRAAAFKRNFDEKSKLKTYLYTTIARLVFDYQDKYHVKDENNVTKRVEPNPTNNIDTYPSDSISPFNASVVAEIKERVEKLPYIEKLAFEFYYYDGITKFSKLGEAMKTTRYKAKKILECAEKKVFKGEFENVGCRIRKKGDKKREKKNDTHGN